MKCIKIIHLQCQNRCLCKFKWPIFCSIVFIIPLILYTHANKYTELRNWINEKHFFLCKSDFVVYLSCVCVQNYFSFSFRFYDHRLFILLYFISFFFHCISLNFTLTYRKPPMQPPPTFSLVLINKQQK